MTTKNLAIRDEVYRKLVETKLEGESFSDTIDRLIEKKSSLLSFWGALKDSKNLEGLQEEVGKIRKRAVIRVR